MHPTMTALTERDKVMYGVRSAAAKRDNVVNRRTTVHVTSTALTSKIISLQDDLSKRLPVAILGVVTHLDCAEERVVGLLSHPFCCRDDTRVVLRLDATIPNLVRLVVMRRQHLHLLALMVVVVADAYLLTHEYLPA